MRRIYLDNNATTPLDPRVAEIMFAASRELLANPASPHTEGRHARRLLEDAREEIAAGLGARVGGPEADTLVFTSGGTESNNLALCGLAGPPPGRIVISAIEHPSVAGPAAELARRGFVVQTLPVTADGVVDLTRCNEWLTPDTRLVSVMLANHETGVRQPVAEIARRCRASGIRMHTDAVQVVGKMAVDFRGLGVDALSFAAHKLHGPVGIGGLLLRAGVTPQPLMYGGFQQRGWRPGTEPVMLVLGMYAALRFWQAEGSQRTARLAGLRDTLECQLLAGPTPAVVHGRAAARVPHACNISFPGCDRQALLMALDLAGVACSSGSACASGSSEPSPVLRAMGLAEDLVFSALRLSVGTLTTPAEVNLAAERILAVVKDLRTRAEARKTAGPSRQSAAKPL